MCQVVNLVSSVLTGGPWRRGFRTVYQKHSKEEYLSTAMKLPMYCRSTLALTILAFV